MNESDHHFSFKPEDDDLEAPIVERAEFFGHEAVAELQRCTQVRRFRNLKSELSENPNHTFAYLRKYFRRFGKQA